MVEGAVTLFCALFVLFLKCSKLNATEQTRGRHYPFCSTLSYKNIPLALKSLLIIFFIVPYSAIGMGDPSISGLMNCWKTF